MKNKLAVSHNSGAAHTHNEISWSDFELGSHRAKCPNCGRDRAGDKTLGVTIKHDGHGIAHCFRCSYTSSIKPKNSSHNHTATRSKTMTFKRDGCASLKRSELSDYGRTLWASCVSVKGTTGEAYLAARNCLIPPLDGHLRFHPSLKHGPTGFVGPALVCLVTDALTGVPMSLHRTWIAADGRKAPIEPPRLMLGGHTKKGGVIRLWPDDCVVSGIAIAEGVETCLSLAHAFTPVWALIDAGNLAEFPVMSGIETLLIGQDRDPAGEQAARTCAKRWSAAGVTVRITMQTSNDLNDCVREAL